MTGNQFKKLRKELGYTQASLAKRFECSSRTIRNLQLENHVKGMVALAMQALVLEKEQLEKEKEDDDS